MKQAISRKEREVWHALNVLRNQGYPEGAMTGILIGETLVELGYSRGSNTDIFRYKRSWLAANAPTINNDGSDELKLPSPIAAAVAQVERELETQFQEKEKVIVQKAQEEIAAVKLELQHKQQALEKIQEKLDQSLNFIKELKIDKKALEEVLKQEQKQTIEATTQVEYLKQTVAHATDNYQKHVEDLKTAHQQTIDNLKKEIVAINNLHKQQVSDLKGYLENGRQQFMVKLDAIRTENKELVKKLSQLETENVNLKEKNSNLSATINNLQKQDQSDIELRNQLGGYFSANNATLAEMENKIKVIHNNQLAGNEIVIKNFAHHFKELKVFMKAIQETKKVRNGKKVAKAK